MKPSAWMYGGVHDDPGSRRRFLETLAAQRTPPHFVAVEWEQSVFTHLIAWRPQVAEGLRARWGFLTREDCDELSRALAWEGDAYVERFPGVDPVWLECGVQARDLEWRSGGDADAYLKGLARGLWERLCQPYPPFEPEPRTKHELIEHAWRSAWAMASAWRDENFERDARWAQAIIARSAGLRGGWIAVVSGWAHADPAAGPQRLRGLLTSQGFKVHPVRLGPYDEVRNASPY